MKFSLKNTYHFLRDMARVIIRGELDSPDFIILDEKEVVFASVAKSACSSIKTSIYGTPPEGILIHQHTSHLSHRRIPKEKASYFVFAIVRDPYERLASCYRAKFHHEDESKFMFSNYLFGYLKNDDSFEEFVRKVSKIPDALSDRHFKAQNQMVFAYGTKVDFIGKFENLTSDFEKIRERFDFEELPILNKSSGKSADDLFSDETRALASKRYEKDFEIFGYSN
ncbi:MAG: sulfotransferase family 2 domain-containing protein [Candidatus Thermoplasmatota archaeon]|nr:sulfotransferase family 2 domain-containing protein [Candidatus Thermoplasmatota archaeon]